MVNLKITVSAVLISVVLVLSGVVYEWQHSKDYSTLYRNNVSIARSQQKVELERDWSTIKYSYQRDNCLRDGGRVMANGTRCYYPENFFVALNRKLLGIKLYGENVSDSFITNRITPFYKYGTSGALAGSIAEKFFYHFETDDEKEFPYKYLVSYQPKDNSNYRIVWRVDKLKGISLADGKYHDCSYTFGDVRIDLKTDCSKLDYAEVKNSDKRVWFYFKKGRGLQTLDLNLIDPDTGALHPKTVKDSSAIGTTVWNTPEKGNTSDNVYAWLAEVYPVTSHYLNATNFGFTIPTGSTINGILVEIEKRDDMGGAAWTDFAVKIVLANGTIGSVNEGKIGTNWPAVDTYVSYGNSTYLWGETWTAEDINDIDFGVVLSATYRLEDEVFYGNVDDIRMTVYYTEGVTNTCTYSSGTWNVDCADNCLISTPVDVGNNNINIDGTGVFNLDADVQSQGIVHISGDCVVHCGNGCFV